MTEILLGILILLAIVILIVVLRKTVSVDITPQMKEVESSIFRFETTLEKTEKSIKDEFQRNRKENNDIAQANREELTRFADAKGRWVLRETLEAYAAADFQNSAPQPNPNSSSMSIPLDEGTTPWEMQLSTRRGQITPIWSNVHGEKAWSDPDVA